MNRKPSSSSTSFLGWATALVLIGLICIPACSRKKPGKEVADATDDHRETEVIVDNTKDARSEKVSEELLAEKLFELMKKAEAQNAQGEFADAYETWKAIHHKVSQKYGTDAWQTVSAELAMTAAQQRTRMTAAEKSLVNELTKLTTSATKSIASQNYNEARIDIEKAAGISTRIWGKESYVSANVNFERARCYLGLGMHERAIAVLNDVLSLRISLLGLNHPDVESTLELLAQSNTALKKHVVAAQLNEKLVTVTGNLSGIDSANYAIRCNELAVNYNNIGQPASALPWFDKALSIRKKNQGDDSLAVGHIYLNRGIARTQLKDLDEAKQDLENAFRIFKLSKLKPEHVAWSLIYDQLGTVALLQKNNAEGQKYFSKLADFWKDSEGENHLEYGKSLYKLSVSIGNQGRYSDAKPIMEKAISIFESNLGYNNKILQQPLTAYARLLEKMGVEQEAQKVKDRAVRLAGFQELPN